MNHYSIALLFLIGPLLVFAQESYRGCAPVDAVTYLAGKRIFISGFTVVPFKTRNRKEDGEIKPLKDWFPEMGYSYKVDAAYHPQNDPTSTILISGNKFFKYDKEGKHVEGPSSLRKIFPRSASWASGVDAAARYNGNEFFFRGCYILIKHVSGRVRRIHSRALRLPCHVDAAFYSSGSVRVMKGDKVYVMKYTPKGFKAVQRVCFARYYQTDFPLCRC